MLRARRHLCLHAVFPQCSLETHKQRLTPDHSGEVKENVIHPMRLLLPLLRGRILMLTSPLLHTKQCVGHHGHHACSTATQPCTHQMLMHSVFCGLDTHNPLTGSPFFSL